MPRDSSAGCNNLIQISSLINLHKIHYIIQSELDIYRIILFPENQSISRKHYI